ncbi:MAG: HAMP domain-containing histidine kinase, partial [Gemmatimonadaceae bacterium]|nr:HAMP domain-containing histidine kinase [Gemmatimonadaceae bacterium]
MKTNEEGRVRPERIAILEAQVLEAQRVINELHSRDALKTQFLSNISHDLRTPLTAIITHAEILRDGMLGELNDRQTQSLAGIITGGRQLLDMIGEILIYAKGAGSQLDLNVSDFAISEVIDHVLAVNEPLAAKKGLAV